MTTQQRRQDIPKAYNPGVVEERLYRFWEEGGYFTPVIDREKKPFVIVMPPPNVTGELHLGHALTATIQDTMIRWHRMRGEPALWLPGSDHAGIATQVVVERELAKEGLTRHQLGREQFLERVWEWVHKYGGIITQQHKRLGASCDWTRQRFTLDPGPSKAVRTTFVNLFRKGLIYRGERIINWCPRCSTALSDLEVEHEVHQGSLYYVHYPFEEGSGYVTVATTRPETLLGDTAVAVNPGDPRYAQVVGKRVLLPVLRRPIPVVGDEAVDPQFGTGALKITPGHDPTDFEVGQRHSLPVVTVINLDGAMNQEAGPYEGMERFACREAILRDLEQQGLLEKTEPYEHSVGHCQRCKTIVEPLVSQQWFVRMSGPAGLARPAMEAVKEGRIAIIPERFVREYLHWMENIRDWCISRQLWWGHRIPVWYCGNCAELTVEVEDPTACAHCGSEDFEQDPDVMDTWFSSALWTHSTLGWPEDTEDLRYFYPTSVMETGYDILFFWVARMIVMGLENLGEIPFHTVFLHGLVRDVEGVKMSKTRGNVIDPLEAVETYGTDALRFALTTGITPGNDTRVTPARLESSRNFANKLWNAARFVMLTLEEQGEASPGVCGWSSPVPDHRHDRWIMSRLDRLVAQVNGLLEEYQFGEAQRAIHDFLWGEYCDWYIEIAKIRLRSGEGPSPLPFLAHALERVLRLLHPFMPFITEEVWQNLVARLPQEVDLPQSVMIALYPTSTGFADERAEEEVVLVTEIVRAIRAVRAEFRIPPVQSLDVVVDAADATGAVWEEERVIKQLARVGDLRVLSPGEERPPLEQAVTTVLSGGVVILPLAGLVDMAAERRRLEKELSDGDVSIGRLDKRLQDEQFLGKAPEAVVERERERLSSLQERRQRIVELLGQFAG